MAHDAIPFDIYATGVIDLKSAASQKVGGGRYCLRRILGRGGMGVVWLAQDERLKNEVALKFLPPQIRSDPVMVDDLRRETARSQKLTHPNIIRIHDLYEDEDDAFISMEYVDGLTLASLRVQEAGRVLSWRFLEPVIRQLCEALEYAHTEQIIHRDLKPANLMVDHLGRLKLADFGIARAITDTMTRNSLGQTTGTLLYMSPQQLEGGFPKVTDDIYGFGATLYELLTSKPPYFTGDLLHQVRNVEAQPLQQRLRELKAVNDIPGYVEDLVLACLSKAESQRPQSAREVAAWISAGKTPVRKSGPGRGQKGTNTRLPGSVRTWKTWCFAGATAAVVAAAARLVMSHTPDRTVAPAGAPSSLPLNSERTVPTTLVKAREVPSPGSPPTMAKSPVKTMPAAPTVPTPVPARMATNRVPKIVTAASDAPTSYANRGDTHRDAIANPPIASRVIPDPPPGNAQPAPPARPKQPTALQLVRQGNTHVSERSKDKVVQIVSERTAIDSPPQNWRIIYYDPKARYKLVEVQFEDGKMSRIHELTRLLGFLTPQAQKPIDIEKLKIDSSDALKITLNLAAIKNLTVQSAELALERGYGGSPVWKVSLFGSSENDPLKEKSLGYAILLTDDGKVLKETLSINEQRVK
jgi:serine/threonine protein kinase